MESINLMEPCDVSLQRQSIRRLRALIAVVMIWVLMMSVMVIGAHWMKQHSLSKLSQVSADLKAIESRVAHQAYLQGLHQDQQNAHCTAKILSVIMASPIEGLYLHSISFSDHWQMAGIVEYPHALDDFKLALSHDFEKITWTEKFVQTNSHFQMEGFQAC